MRYNIRGILFLYMDESSIRLIEIARTILLILIEFPRLRISIASMKSQIYPVILNTIIINLSAIYDESLTLRVKYLAPLNRF